MHLSDALRVLLVWKFGGLYLDLDYIIVNDMSHYQNFLADNGKGVTNNAFSFSPGHPFLNKLMNKLPRAYSAKCWHCIGPKLFSNCLKEYLIEKMKESEKINGEWRKWKKINQKLEERELDEFTWRKWSKKIKELQERQLNEITVLPLER